MYSLKITFFLLLVAITAHAQHYSISGRIIPSSDRVATTIRILNTKISVDADSAGYFRFANLRGGSYQLQVSRASYRTSLVKLLLKGDTILSPTSLQALDETLSEVVITGTQKEVKRLESPVPVEIYSAKFLQKNPSPSLFESLQNINGVRPQLNCNICNTGDIHINGLEGPYTMVLIDGMPIVSSLSTVYGLSGIPSALVDRIEVVKGPASSLYGSEAVGGLINIITKSVAKAPLFSGDLMRTSYHEQNADIGFKLNIGRRTSLLTGINYFNYSNPIDQNKDGFTDITLQDRISVFQKWNINRKNNRLFTLAGRFVYEDRWGGQMNWNKNFRGGDQRYGESIYTQRFEFIGQYQLPVPERLNLSFSYSHHAQDSRYGTTSYIALQRIAFAQLTWDKKIGANDLLLGTAIRHTYYDDNTVATANQEIQQLTNRPQNVVLPGIFLQDEVKIDSSHSFLAGIRYDYHNIHGSIFTPRMAYKWNFNSSSIIRLNAGTGFRVVNIFTEDHAALTGARDLVIRNTLKPERTYNVNINFLKKIHLRSAATLTLDASAFYTYFNNRIIGDYTINPDQIVYDNLNGFAQSSGMTFNGDMVFSNGMKLNLGLTYQDVHFVNDGVKQRQMLTERFSGTWAFSFRLNRMNLGIDYTGNLYSPMRLPVLGSLDPRSPNSPFWSVQNIQFVYDGFKRIEVYGGVKNLLNFTPNKGNAFIIARAEDPFDKNVKYDDQGQVVPTPDNPFALTFDPNYVYAPIQGIRGFLGIRLKF